MFLRLYENAAAFTCKLTFTVGPFSFIHDLVKLQSAFFHAEKPDPEKPEPGSRRFPTGCLCQETIVPEH